MSQSKSKDGIQRIVYIFCRSIDFNTALKSFVVQAPGIFLK
jgi:hypothetical protein